MEYVAHLASLPYGGEVQRIAMTVHSRTYNQITTAELHPPLPNHPHLADQAESGPPDTETPNITAADWYWDFAKTDFRNHLTAYHPLVKSMQHKDAAGKKLIAYALHSGGSHNMVVVDRNALDRESCEILEKLDKLQLSASVHNPSSTSATLAATPEKTEFGDLKFDLKICRAYWKAQPVDLTITQFKIVRLLVRHIGEHLSYREIYDVVHGEGFFAGDGTTGHQTNVRSLIKRIRQRFHEVDDTFDAIKNHRGFGYRWEDVEDGAAAVPTESASDVHNVQEPASRPLVFVILLASEVAPQS